MEFSALESLMLSTYSFQKARMGYFPGTPERLSKVRQLLSADGNLKLANDRELYLTLQRRAGHRVTHREGCYVISGVNPATKYCLFADMS